MTLTPAFTQNASDVRVRDSSDHSTCERGSVLNDDRTKANINERLAIRASLVNKVDHFLI